MKQAYRYPAGFLIVSCMAVLAACGLVSKETERTRVVGFHNGNDASLIPKEVMAGESFQITVYTYGDGCVELGDTESDVNGGIATVTPYDIFVEAAVCAQILQTLGHKVDLTFEKPGTAEIRFLYSTKPIGLHPDSSVSIVNREADGKEVYLIKVLPAN